MAVCVQLLSNASCSKILSCSMEKQRMQWNQLNMEDKHCFSYNWSVLRYFSSTLHIAVQVFALCALHLTNHGYQSKILSQSHESDKQHIHIRLCP